MKLFFFQSQFKKIADHLAKNIETSQIGHFELKKYPNQEKYISVKENVTKNYCYIIGTIAPPENNLWEILQTTNTLKKEGAKKIILILPYLAYARHDKNNPGESLNAQLTIELLQKAGADKIITLDIHSQKIINQTNNVVESISTGPVFAKEINQKNIHDTTFVSPDQGAIDRTNAIKKILQINNKNIYFQKKTSTRKNHLQHQISNQYTKSDYR